jgi:hypothetical protein
MRWFQNLACGSPFDEGQLSADFSLQLSAAVANFEDWNAEGGMSASSFKPSSPVTEIHVTSKGSPNPTTIEKVYPVLRNQ